MRIDRKKAQGEIITTILLILLVLAVVVIVWQVIKGTVEKGAAEVEAKSQCIGLDLSIESVTCTIADVKVTVHRGADSIATTAKDGKNLRVLATDSTGTSKSAVGIIEALGTANIIPAATGLMTGSKTTVTVALVLDSAGTVCEGVTEEFTC